MRALMGFLAPLWLARSAPRPPCRCSFICCGGASARASSFPRCAISRAPSGSTAATLRLRNLLLMLLRVRACSLIALAAARPIVRMVGRRPRAHRARDRARQLAQHVGGRRAAARAQRAAGARAGRPRGARPRRPRSGSSPPTASCAAAAATRCCDAAAHTEPFGGAGDLRAATSRAATLARARGARRAQIAVLTDGQAHELARAARARRRPAARLRARRRRRPRIARCARRARDPGALDAARRRRARASSRRDSATYRITLERPHARARHRGARTRKSSCAPSRRSAAGSPARWSSSPTSCAADNVRHFAVWIGAGARGRAPPARRRVRAQRARRARAERSRERRQRRSRSCPATRLTTLPALLIAPRSGQARRGESRARAAGRAVALRRARSTASRWCARGQHARARGRDRERCATSSRAQPARSARTRSRPPGGAPWIVAGARLRARRFAARAARDDLPVRASFVPWLDDMLVAAACAASGGIPRRGRARRAASHAPPAPTRSSFPRAERRPLSGDSLDAPARAGTYFFLRGTDARRRARRQRRSRRSPSSRDSRRRRSRASSARARRTSLTDSAALAARACSPPRRNARSLAPLLLIARAHCSLVETLITGVRRTQERRVDGAPALLDAVDALPAYRELSSTRFPRPATTLTSAGSRARATRRSSPRSARSAADALLRDSSPRRCPRPSGGSPISTTLADGRRGRALSAARRIRRSRAARGGRGRARRDARAHRARRGAHAPHDRARAARAHAAAARAARSARSSCARATRSGSSELAAHLESIGFERVPMVEDVAQFSVRGGIFDVYSFGMAEPVRARVLGRRDRRAAPLRSRSRSARRATSTSRSCFRSTASVARGRRRARRAASIADALSARHAARRAARHAPRAGAAAHLGRGAASHRPRAPPRRGRAESRRAVRVARRAQHARGASARSARSHRDRPTAERARDVVFPLRPPEAIDRDIKRLERLVARRHADVILCDNEGQCERLDELLNEDDARPVAGGARRRRARRRIRRSAVARASEPGLRVLTDHEIFRRERRIRRARRYVTGTRARDASPRSSPATTSCISSTASGSIAASRQIFVRREHDRGRGHRVRGRRPAQRPALPHRPARALSLRPTTSPSDAPPPRLHKLGGKRWAAAARQDARGDPGDDASSCSISTRAARSRRVRRTCPTRRGSGSSSRRSSSRTRPTSARRPTRSRRDMESTRPMDRLLVGDVGYGKTEIAVRAAFKAVQSGRQVAVLVPDDDSRRPARAHLQRAPRRFSDEGRGAVAASRRAKEQTATLAELAEKKVDIVIGTHRLLSADVDVRAISA